MITFKGQFFVLISTLFIVLGNIFDSYILLIVGFSLLLFLIYIFINFIFSDFSDIYSKYFYYPIVYEQEKISIKLIIDIKKNNFFKLYYYYPEYVNIIKGFDDSLFENNVEYNIDISFKRSGRFNLPFSKIIIYEENKFFYQFKDLDNLQKIFVKKRKPPLILTERDAKANILKIGKLHTRQSVGEDDFKQLRNYVLGDDLRKIDWKSSAKLSKLIVKESYPEGLNNFFIIFDAGAGMNIGKYENILDNSIFALETLLNTLSKTRNYLSLEIFDKETLLFEKNLIGNDILHKFHDKLYKIEGDKSCDYIKNFDKLSKKIKRRSIIIIISNFSKKFHDMSICLDKLVKAKHKIIILYPFEPLFEKDDLKTEEEKMTYDSLILKYNREFEIVEKVLKNKYIKIIKFGPNDYDKIIIKALTFIEKKEF